MVVIVWQQCTSKHLILICFIFMNCQVICKECGHVSEREVQFVVVEVNHNTFQPFLYSIKLKKT